MESSSKFDVGCDQERLLTTPNTDWDFDTFVVSMNDDSSSHSSSSWDLEDYFDSISNSVNVVGEGLSELKEDYFGLEHQNKYGSYDELLKKFNKKEEELRVSNYKLEHFEEEVIKLKNQIEQSKGQLDDVQKELKRKESYLEQFEGKLDDMSKELKLKEDDLEHEIGQVLDMQKQKAEQAILVQDYCHKITKLEELLEVVNEKLKISSNEVERLTKELGSKLYETHELQCQLKVADEYVAKLECECDSRRKHIQDLEEMITWYKANETKIELEVQKFKDEMVDAWTNFYLEKVELHSDIESLSETNMDMISRVKEWEERSNAYENKLSQCEATNLELKELHVAQQMALHGEINSLKEEVGQGKEDVEAVDKKSDVYKQKKLESIRKSCVLLLLIVYVFLFIGAVFLF